MSVVARGLAPFQISICGVAELPGFAARDVSHVVGILDPGTPRPEAYAELHPAEPVEFRFHDIVEPEPLRLAPSVADVAAIIDAAERIHAARPTHLLVHCYAGVSRSTATAVIVMAMRNPGREAEIFAALRDIRPRAWPNSLMIRHADHQLGLGGALVSAMKAHHLSVAETHADVRQLIAAVGRGHELPPTVR